MLTFRFLRQADWINAKRSVGYPCALLAVYVFLTVIWIAQVPVIPQHDGVEFSQDFMNVYAAGKTVHEESAAQVYDWKFQKEQQRHLKATGSGAAPDEHYVPWWYPPTFLCVAWLLALAPYYGALAIYLIGGFAAYAVSIYRLAGWKQAKWAIIAFPGVYGNLFAGQNGFITTALMAGGLSLVARTPIAAGVFFGALSFKPQFFVLIPVALLAGRYWKALASSLVSAGVFALASLAVFGAKTWEGFFDSLGAARTNMLENTGDRWLGIMHTSFSMVRMYGGDIRLAMTVQVFVAIASLAVLVALWRRKDASLAVKGAALVGVSLLASPYSFYYDEVILAIPIALLARRGIETGFLPYEKLVLFMLWLLPVLAKDSGESYRLPLGPPMFACLIYICWRRASFERLGTVSPVRS